MRLSFLMIDWYWCIVKRFGMCDVYWVFCVLGLGVEDDCFCDWVVYVWGDFVLL